MTNFNMARVLTKENLLIPSRSLIFFFQNLQRTLIRGVFSCGFFASCPRKTWNESEKWPLSPSSLIFQYNFCAAENPTETLAKQGFFFPDP